jgi:hypothetical protein
MKQTLLIIFTAVLLFGCNPESWEIHIGDSNTAESEAVYETPLPAPESAEIMHSELPEPESIDSVHIGSVYRESIFICTLNGSEHEELWRLLRVDEWRLATDLPVSGFEPVLHIVESTGQAWGFSRYFESVIIIPSQPNPDTGEKICYYLPDGVLSDIFRFVRLSSCGLSRSEELRRTEEALHKGVSAADVKIHFATDEEHHFFDGLNSHLSLERIGSYQLFTDPDVNGQWDNPGIVFTTSIPVRDFRYIAVEYDEHFCPAAGKTLYSHGVLDMPLAAVWIHMGCFTSARGISFTDEDGAPRFFEIGLSNADGSLYLAEFDPDGGCFVEDWD